MLSELGPPPPCGICVGVFLVKFFLKKVVLVSIW